MQRCHQVLGTKSQPLEQQVDFVAGVLHRAEVRFPFKFVGEQTEGDPKSCFFADMPPGTQYFQQRNK